MLFRVVVSATNVTQATQLQSRNVSNKIEGDPEMTTKREESLQGSKMHLTTAELSEPLTNRQNGLFLSSHTIRSYTQFELISVE